MDARGTSSADGIICFSTDPWGEMKRPGQLMLCLRERVPVVYVEPTLSVTSLLKNWRSLFSPQTRSRLRRALVGRPEEVVPGVHVISALISVPPQRLSFVKSASALGAFGDMQQRRAARRARRAAEHVGIVSPVVWVTYPGARIGGASKGACQALVYDCMDRWTDFPDSAGNARLRELVEAYEGQLLQEADVVLCSAKGLYESKAQVARGRVHLVRNGADIEHFAPAYGAVPEDIAHLPRPMIGYVGAVAEWVDFELIGAAARMRPEWSFVLVGPAFKGGSMGDSRAAEPLCGLPNVHLLGSRPYVDVPAYVEAFDVATIPFQLNGLTDDTNPIKVYEYLAAGVPVVSTALPEVVGLPEVRVATGAAEFVDECEAARRSRHDASLIAVRIGVAAENSWEARAGVAWDAVCADG